MIKAKKWLVLFLAVLTLPLPSAYAGAEEWLVEDTFTGEYEEFTGNPRTITLNNWEMLNISNRGNANFNYYRVKEQPNGYLSFGRQGNPSHYGMGAQRVISEEESGESGRYVMEIDVRMDFPGITGNNHGAYTDFSIYGMVNGAEKKLLTLTRNNMDSSNPSAMKESPNATDLYVSTDPTGKIVIPNMRSDSWYKLRLEMNLTDGLYDVYVDDAQKPAVALCSMNVKGATRISKVDFQTAATGTGSNNLPGLFGIDVDNFRLRTLPEDGASVIAQDEERLKTLDLSVLRGDIELPAQMSSVGSTMTWTSENSAIQIPVSAVNNVYAARVTRPDFGQSDSVGDLVVTLSAGGEQKTVRYSVTVPAKVADSDIVMADLAKIELDGKKFSEAFLLPSEGEGGTQLQWQSNHAAAQIGTAGAGGVPVTVTRPGEEEPDAEVTLTVKASYGSSTQEKQYQITILKLPTVKDTFTGVYLEEFTGNPKTITLDNWEMLNIADRGNANFHYYKVKDQPDGFLSFGRVRLCHYGIGAQRVIREEESGESERYVMEIDVRMNFPKVAGEDHGVYTDFSVYGIVNGAERKLLTLTRNTVDGSNESVCKKSPNPTDLYVSTDPTGKIVIPNMEWDWYKLRIEMNLADGLYDVYVNGAQKPAVALCSMSAKGVSRISKVDFQTPTMGNSSNNIYGLIGVDVDNFRLRTLPEAGASAIAQDEERLKTLDLSVLRENVELPAQMSSVGSVMTWTSENPAIQIPASAANKVYAARVTRPAFGQPDSTGDLVVTLSAGGEQKTVRYPVTVPAGTADSDVVMADLAKLALDGKQFSEAFLLPSEGEGGTKLQWQSNSAAAQIGTAGADGVPVTVTRPGEEDPDAEVTLTVKASYGSFTHEKQYQITVLKLPVLAEEEKLEEDARLLKLEKNVVSDSLTVPALGAQYGSEITWSASPSGIVAWGEPKDGVYTAAVKQGETTVTLTVTATLKRGAETRTKTFTVRVVKQSEQQNVNKAQKDADALSLGKTDAINNDFTLPAIGSLYGSAVSWSSDSPYLHITKTEEQYFTAEITQPPQKTEASLTATVTNGGQTAERVMIVTLVPKYSMETTHSVISDDFDGNKYLNPGDLLGTQTLANWTMVNGSNRPKGNLYFQIDTEGNNGVLRMERTENYYSIYSYREFATTAGRNVNMQLRAKIDAESQKGVRVYFAIYGKLQNGSEVQVARMVKRHNDDALRLIRADESPLTDANGKAVVIEKCASDIWYDFRWEMNMEAHTYDLYVNDTLALQTVPLLGQAVQISKIQMEIPNTKNEEPQLNGGGGVQIDYFNVTETAAPALAVQEELAAITLPESVTSDLELPTCGSVHGANIEWSSSTPETISVTGAVYREPSDGADRTVQLTAAVSAPDAAITETRTFTIIVPKMQTNAEMAAADLALARPPAKAYFDLDLPSIGALNGSEIFWSSTDVSVIGTDGAVMRGNEEKRVSLTAEVICVSDSHSETHTRKETFEVIVPARAVTIPDEETLSPGSASWWGSSETAARDILFAQDGVSIGGSSGAYAVRDVPAAKSGFFAKWEAQAESGLLQMQLHGEGKELLSLTLGGGKLTDGDGNTLAPGIAADSPVTISLEGDLRGGSAVLTAEQDGAVVAESTLKMADSSLASISFGGAAGTETAASVSGVICYPTFAYEVAQDIATVTVEDKQTVTESFSLPAAGAQYDTAFTWESSKPSVIRVDNNTAVVTRPEGGYATAVLLTLTAKQGRTEMQKQYTITVLPNSPIQTGGGSGGSGGGSSKGKGTIQAMPSPPSDTEQQESVPFGDLDDAAWASRYISELHKLGVISGREEGRFCPNDAITREEYLKLLISGLGFIEQTQEETEAFTDAEPGAWYESYLYTAKSLGIVNGRPDGSFGVGEQINRADMAVMAGRAMTALGLQLTPFDGEAFADDEQIAEYAKDNVYRMAGAGILNGIGDGVFAPNRFATRAQAAKMIYHILEQQVKGR